MSIKYNSDENEKKTAPQYVCTNTQYAVGQYEWHMASVTIALLLVCTKQ